MKNISNSFHIKRKLGKLSVLIAVVLLLILAAWNYNGMYKPNAKLSTNKYKKVSICFPEMYSVAGSKIYYISPVDNFIYELDTASGSKQLIGGNRADEIGLIYENSWIYYISLEDSSFNRVNTNSKKTEKISESLSCISENFLKYNDSLYYFDDCGNIHLINNDGSSRLVNDYTKTTFLYGIKRYTKVSDQWIYTWDMFSIYRTSIEGGEWEKIMDNVYPLYEVYNDCIYYVDNTDYKLYKTNLKTMEKEIICNHYVIQQGADFDGGNMVVSGDYLYHTAFFENIKPRLYKINLKSGSESIVSNMTAYFTIYDEYIYYIDNFDSGKLYEKKIKNTSEKILTSGGLMPYIDVKDGIIIYASKSVDTDDYDNGRLFAIYMDKKFELK